MISGATDIIGNLFLITGSLFLFSAGLGVLRMPDTYNRIQTGTKATTLGTILILVGIAFLHPAWTLKLMILIFFVLLTNPVSSHALARASHTIGTYETESTVIDKLDEAEHGDDVAMMDKAAVDQARVDQSGADTR